MRPPAGTRRVRRDGWDVLVAAGGDAVLDAVLPDPAGRAATGEVLRRSRHRTTARVTGADGRPALLKAHGAPRGLLRWLSLVRPSRARAEWEAARYLLAAGLPAAPPLACGERRRGPFEGPSFLAAAFLPDARPLEAEEPPIREHVAAAARLARALHDLGFDHRDLHAGNLLAVGGRLVAADLHRRRLGAPVGEARRVAALARLAHSLRHGLGPAGRLRLLRDYGPPAPRDLLRRRRRRLEAAVGRLEATRRRSRSRRVWRESTAFTGDVGPGRGARRRDLPPERLERALAEHDAARAAGDGRVAKTGSRGVVTCHGDLVVKEALRTGLLARARGALAPWRAGAGFANAHALAVRGVGTARPLAFLRRGGRTFTLAEDLSRLPRLDHAARALFGGHDAAAARRLLGASADFVATLHRGGVYHGDLKGVNVRVDPAGGPRFLLIDTDRCRFGRRPVGTRRRVKNLAQLAASIPRVVTRTDRLRWFRRYAAGGPLAAREREVARRVARHLARKVVVVDEPIE